ncbi:MULTISPECIES: ABC transporter permease [Caproicibacterium]|uniref:Uncharacterized protein n=1 Tax=Caproicibacterium argilliputei TaxID=3030016 RepID=A0AA97H1K2_9FIRM|nr:hypothetical protein [Caproicibacterium argilliputei]WOC31800.1 hypothetical protein PXC00_11455 [Caproicibacterium argilliputei]
MWKQIKLLTGVELRGAFSPHEARRGMNTKKQRNGVLLAALSLFAGLLLMFYIAVLTAGLAIIGMARIVPALLCILVSLMILFFTIFKSGGILFNLQTYERVIVLPVEPAAILISRFLTIYLFDVVLSLPVILPGMVVYGFFQKPAASFYIAMLLGIFFIPLLPITVAAAIGALVTAVSSRMKHKTFFTTLLSVVAVLAVCVASFAFSAISSECTTDQITAAAAVLYDEVCTFYPPAVLFSEGAVDGSLGSYLLFMGISLLLFGLFAWVVQRKFVAISTALSAHEAKRNYVMRTQAQTSVPKALYRKELKRYFASSVYVLNTVTCYLMMVITAVAIAVAGTPLFHEVPKFRLLLPLFVALLACISPTTASAISIEGKQWDLLKSLPLSSKEILNSKLLVSLTIALPCWAATVLIVLSVLRLNAVETLWLLLVPLLYILFSSVLGLFINLKMPNFSWDSEAAVVKQSAAVVITMLLGLLSAGVPLILVLLLSAGLANLILTVTSVLFAVLTLFLYRMIHHVSLTAIS